MLVAMLLILAAGFVCDLWNGADGVAGGDDDSERKTNYGSVHSGTDNLDICIADPTCSDGVQNNNEGGVDCCLLDSAGNPHGGCNCKHLDYCIDPVDDDGNPIRIRCGTRRLVPPQ